MMTSRSWSSGVGWATCPGSSVCPCIVAITCALVLLPAPSSTWNKVSSPRSLIDCNSAVAMFICVSSVCLRAVSSGSAVMAVLRLAVFELRSICEMSFTSDIPVERVISAASDLYRLNSASMSSATCGNGFGAFFSQKKSFESMS